MNKVDKLIETAKSINESMAITIPISGKVVYGKDGTTKLGVVKSFNAAANTVMYENGKSEKLDPAWLTLWKDGYKYSAYNSEDYKNKEVLF